MTNQDDEPGFERAPLPEGVGGFEPGAPAEVRVPEHILVPRPSLHPSVEEISALLKQLEGTGFTLVPVSDQVRSALDVLSIEMGTENFSETIQELIALHRADLCR